MKKNIKSPKTEQLIKKILSPFESFFSIEASSGLSMLIGTIFALIFVNSPYKNLYEDFIHLNFSLKFGTFEISHTLSHWINDGFMTFFFYIVGMEIKKEIFIGELSSVKKALLPIFAAVGGMIVPAILYSVVNLNGPGIQGWGIPTATDIAFAVGVLTLMSSRIPASLKVFLLALAIADDLGAVILIAFFYTQSISWSALVIACLFMLIIYFTRSGGVYYRPFYFILSILVWFCFLKSGIHATISGVLIGFLVPIKSVYDSSTILKYLKKRLNSFSQSKENDSFLVEETALLSQQAISPLIRSTQNLHRWVSFFIMPLFAFVNSGISFQNLSLNQVFNQPIVLGIILGLCIGKPIGVFLMTWITVKLKLADLPKDMNWYHVFCVGLLAGVGFTMSLFVSHLALDKGELESYAKIGILIASALSSIIGLIFMSKLSDRTHSIQ